MPLQLRAPALLVALCLPTALVGCSDQKMAGQKDKSRQVSLAGEGGRADAETYARVAENPFFRAEKTPLSTFSVDVDTASYSNVRRFLAGEGRLPPADAVRVEELVNYFPYGYAAPKPGHPVAFTLEVGPCPWKPGHRLARIGLAAKVLGGQDMPPRNLVFLIDTSGSMSPANRLPLLRSSLKLLVGQLTGRDRVAIVTYAGSAGLVLDSTAGDDKGAILAAIDRLEAGGSTAGGAGIQLAYEVARRQFREGAVNRVILGTDGDFNVGVRSEADLTRLIEEQRKGGVYLTVLGFGMGNLKDSALEALAHHGNGHYAYIDGEREARKVFVEQGAALATVAKDVKLQVEFNPRRVGAYRLIGYENRLLRDRDFKDDGKDAGDMGSGHTVTAFYEIVPPGLPVPAAGVDPLKYQSAPSLAPAADSDEWLTVKLRYKDPEGAATKEIAQVLAGPVPKLGDTSADFRFASAVASFGMLLRDSPHKGDATFASVRAQAAGALGDDPGEHRAGFLGLVDAAAKLKK